MAQASADHEGTREAPEHSDTSQSGSALERTVSLLEAALESTADGILVVDRKGRIVRSNRRFIEMWRIPPEVIASGDDDKAIGHVLEQLLEPQVFIDRVRALYARPEASSFDTLRFHDGRVFERYSQPQHLGGTVVGRVWSFRDVTHRVRVEEERNRLLESERAARVAAEDALRVRDEFLSVASHELRTPLQGLRLLVQGLEEGLSRGDPLEPGELEQMLAISGRQLGRLDALVGLLLDVSRLREGGMTLQREYVDLGEVVAESSLLLAKEASRVESELRVCTVPVIGRWDRMRLEQVVTNLITNAIKFGRGAPIEVEAMPDGDRARLRVRDHGVGISPEVMSVIFQPFGRAASSRNYPGLGLGLYIARVIVEAHGGRITVDSEPGEGSCFIVTLPLVPPTESGD